MRALQMLSRSAVGLIQRSSPFAIAVLFSLAAGSLAAQGALSVRQSAPSPSAFLSSAADAPHPRSTTGPEGWMPSDTLEITGLPTTLHVTQASWAITLCSPWYDGPEEEDEAKHFIINALGDTVVMNDTPEEGGGGGCGTYSEVTMPLVEGYNQLTIRTCGAMETEPDQWSYGCETRVVTHWYYNSSKTFGANVLPVIDTVTHVGALPRSVYTQFTVQNTGTTHQHVQVSIIACTGVVSGCVFTAAPGGTSKVINLLYPSAPTFGVSYQIGSAGWGTIKFVASSYGGGAGFTTFTDTGVVHVNGLTSIAGNGPFTLNVRDPNPGTAISRGACVSIPAGRRAAVECGDLRVVQPLPSTTTMDRERTPVLTYLSRHAVPGSGLNIDIDVDSITATQLLFILKIPGKDTISRYVNWNPAWSNGDTRRVVLPINAAAKSLSTGVYAYTMEVWALTDGVPTYARDLPGDTLVVVNRTASPFGTGWWLDGYEQLQHNAPDTTRKLWIGGDGSTRVYTKQTNTVWTVVPTVDRPDTLLKVDSSETTLWRRQLGNGAYVQFNNAGLHVATVNDRGHKTRFVHDGARLDSIVLPVPATSAITRAYWLKYTTLSDGDMLDTVHAPRSPATSARVSKVLRTGRTVTGFTFTDGGNTTFTGGTTIASVSHGATLACLGWGYNGTWAAYTGGCTLTGGTNAATITYGANTLVTAVALTALGTTSICPQEGRTLVCGDSAKINTAASTFINGPQVDTVAADTTRIWQNRYGAAMKVQDPRGNLTTIYRASTSFPMLVTSVVAPNGFTQRTTYTSRGLIDSVIAENPYGTSHNAVTRFTWHSTLNRVTQVIGPTGDTRSFAYDSSGLMTYEEDGRGSSTRTNYEYDAAKRLAYVQPPGHSSSQRYAIQYDSLLGNLRKAITPLGFVTETIRDTIGRPVTIITPIDSNPSSSVKAKRVLTYNAWGCVLTTDDKPNTSGYEPTYSFSSISGTASNSDQYITNTCDGPRVTVTTIDGVEFAITQNPYGRSSCGGVTCTYDSAGNVSKMTTSSGDVTFRYDAFNRVIERRTSAVSESILLAPGQQGYTSPLGGGLPFPALGMQFPYYTTSGNTLTIPADTARFVYDSVTGNLLKAYNRDARINRSYYPSGALKADSLRIGKYVMAGDTSSDFSAHVYVLKYEYDLAGRRTRMQVPTNLGAGCTASTCYQDYHYLAHLGAVDSITSHQGDKFTFTYDDAGRLSSRTAPGHVDLAWAYDLDDRVIRRLERRDVGGATDTVHLDSLWYDARGKINKAVLNGSVDSVQLARFAYDRHGYLSASEFVRSIGTTFTRNEVFQFDANGNVTSAEKNKSLSGAVTREFTYDDGRLVSASQYATGDQDPAYLIDVSTTAGPKQLKTALEYAAGSPYPGTLTGNGYESAAWHQLDGKIRYFQRVGDDANPDTRFVFEEYRYDAFGRRVLLRSRGGCAASYCKSAVERFVWDGAQILFEMRVPGADSVSSAALETDTSTVSAHYGRVGYVHGGGIDAPVGLYRNGTGLIPHANWRGFYDAGTDTSGTAVTSTVTWIAREQSPFMDNQRPDSVKGWAGSLMNAAQDQSGLFYRRNRYYDAGGGRFTQTDPIGIRGGFNLYGYGLADPVNNTDPFGLSCDLEKTDCDRILTAILALIAKGPNSVCSLLGWSAAERFFSEKKGVGYKLPPEGMSHFDPKTGQPLAMGVNEDRSGSEKDYVYIFGPFRVVSDAQKANGVAHEEAHHWGMGHPDAPDVAKNCGPPI